MYIFNELHCAEEEAELPIVSPVFAAEDELAGLPRAIICYADNDCLKAEFIWYIPTASRTRRTVTSV